MARDNKNLKAIYLSGLYRSGTTLTSRMLNNHPDLAVIYDSVHFMRFSYDRYDPVTQCEELVKEIHERLRLRWNMNFDLNIVLESLSKESKLDYATIYDTVMYDLLLKDSTKKYWGEKTNVCWGPIPKFFEMYPKGKVIHIVRDPRDVTVSYRTYTGEPGLRYLDAAFASRSSMEVGLKNKEKFPEDRFTILKYENLANDPVNEMKRICEFLEVEFDNSLLDANKFTDRENKLWTGDSSFSEAIIDISNKPVGRYKIKLNPVELFFVEMICNDMLVRYDYELSAKRLNKEEWGELYDIVNDSFIKNRFDHWLKTAEGTEQYPSDPIAWAIKDMDEKRAKEMVKK